jgi:hypothetical protein
MDFLKDRRLALPLLGGALALLAGLAVAGFLVSQHRDESPPPAPAAQGGLVIDKAAAPEDEGKLDPAKPLRCFVEGQFVGELTLADCAKRNGVATGALDVGVDQSGALAAAGAAGTVLTPLPPPQTAPAAAAPATAVASTAASGGPVGSCWRYSAGDWRELPTEISLNACVQTLFAGRCEKTGGATYGRWMSQTLRLVPGKVEVSGDNRNFRTLAEQSNACVIAPIG